MNSVSQLAKKIFSYKPTINRNYIRKHFFDDNFEIEQILSTRETNCLYLMVMGMTAKQIAQNLKISPKTVESYISNIKVKFDCIDRYEVITKTLLNKHDVLDDIKESFKLALLV